MVGFSRHQLKIRLRMPRMGSTDPGWDLLFAARSTSARVNERYPEISNGVAEATLAGRKRRCQEQAFNCEDWLELQVRGSGRRKVLTALDD